MISPHWHSLLHPFVLDTPSEEQRADVPSLSPTPQKAGSLLRAARLHLGGSQNDVAAALAQLDPGAAVDQKTVSRWECSMQKPSPRYRKRLCQVFGRTADQLGLL